MIITSLKKKNNNIILVFDDSTFITLDYRTVIDYGLRRGDEISEEIKNEMLGASNYFKARDSAFRFISRRMHTAYELRIKLLKKKYTDELIELVINDLTEKKFLNEEEFIRAFTAEKVLKKKIGINKLKSEMLKKGIDRKFIENIKNDVNPSEYRDNILLLASKKLELIKSKEKNHRKIRAKLFSYLMQKGYETDIIHEVLNKLNIDEDE
jgi:regulatory protein